MTDIFESWKSNKFVVTDSSMIDMVDTNLIILTQIDFWNDNYDLLHEWCEQHGAEVRGMTVTCDDLTLTAFALRWS